jgi:hypothetical protein
MPTKTTVKLSLPSGENIVLNGDVPVANQGTPVVAATKTTGNPNGSAHGTVAGTNVTLNNPA